MRSKSVLILPFVLSFFNVTTMAGGYMDVWWHVSKKVETFYTLPHLIIYVSVFLGGMATLSAVVYHLIKMKQFAPANIPQVRGLALAGTGSLLELLAGISDNIYHSIMGFDVTLWSPPHLLVIFGGVVNALGVTELFLSGHKGIVRRVGAVFGLGLAVGFFHFSMTEYDVRTMHAMELRWVPYTAYYAILMIPVIAYATVLGTKRLGTPVGTGVTLIAFLLKLAAYGSWSATDVNMHFPLYIFFSGALYDIVLLLLRSDTRFVHYVGVSAMAVGLVTVVAMQSPLGIKNGDLLISFIGTIILGLAFAWDGDRVVTKESQAGKRFSCVQGGESPCVNSESLL